MTGIVWTLRSRFKHLICTRVWKMAIHPSAQIAPTALLDRTNPRGISIGQDAVIGDHVSILTHDITRAMEGDTRIGARTIIEARAIVMPGVTIGADCLVQPGALVNADMPDRTSAIGNPAKISPRDRAASPEMP